MSFVRLQTQYEFLLAACSTLRHQTYVLTVAHTYEANVGDNFVPSNLLNELELITILE